MSNDAQAGALRSCAMSPPPLACTVRDCGLAVERRGRTWTCARGHAYDIAREGYVNLLQPQDRRSLEAGDAKAAVDARARLLDAGLGRALLDAFVERAAPLVAPGRDVVAELGSGTGALLAALARAVRITGVGIDLSTAAAAHAARRFPELTWAVANADRHLPLVDGCVDMVLSLHARRNPAECRRVLTAEGRLLVAVPAADDLIELRESVLGGRVERDRAGTLIAEHAPFFHVEDRATVRVQQRATREQVLDLLRSTYRGERTSLAPRVAALEALDLTFASELVVFAPAHVAR